MLIVPLLGFFNTLICDDEVHAQTSIHLYPSFPVTLCHGNSYLKGYLNDDAINSNGLTTSSTRPRQTFKYDIISEKNRSVTA